VITLWGRYMREIREGGEHRSEALLSLPAVLGWMADTATGLDRMHHGASEPFLHRDIKPENMFVFEGTGAGAGAGAGVPVVVKLGDLGLAKPVDPALSHLRSTGRSTQIVSPSEVLLDGLYSPGSDVYMWAVSMCMLVIEALGDLGDSVVDTRSQTAIKEAGLALLRPLVPDVADLLTACLDPDRNARPCCNQARDRVLAAAGVWPPLGESLLWFLPLAVVQVPCGGMCSRPDAHKISPLPTPDWKLMDRETER
jgi:serine/threonine protein kinase